MLENIQVVNLPSGQTIGENSGEVFTLSTCQRTLVLGLNYMPFFQLKTNCNEMKVFNGQQAYQYLLEIVCGLQSKLTGESEIVSQVKQAYKEYQELPNKNSHIMTIVEKLLKDAKEIRTQYLVEIGQQSYAGITRKILESQDLKGPVLVLGSGALANDVLQTLSKRMTVYVSARNTEKVNKLKEQCTFEVIPWGELDSYKKFSVIINTIGADEVLFNQNFFKDWDILSHPAKAFIDLGSPSVIETQMGPEQGVHKLEQVFEFGSELDKCKEEKINKAREAIDKIALKRLHSFTLHYPFGWEDLHLV